MLQNPVLKKLIILKKINLHKMKINIDSSSTPYHDLFNLNMFLLNYHLYFININKPTNKRKLISFITYNLSYTTNNNNF